jgi:hypothetical protein
MCRLAAAAAPLPAARLRVHRLIIAGGRQSAGVVGGHVLVGRRCLASPDAGTVVWKMLRRSAAATR